MPTFPPEGAGFSGGTKSGGISKLPATVVKASQFLAPTGGDDTAQVQAAINALNGSGTIILGPGTFLWTTAVVKLPRNAAGIEIRGSGKSVTTIQLSSGAPRAFDFNKVADYDTFQNITLRDFTVDANSLTGGKNHILIGNYRASGSQLRLNYSNIRIENVDGINLIADTSNVTRAYFVWLASTHAAPGETATNLTDITIRNCNVTGGNFGFDITGNTTGSNATGYTQFIDNVLIENCSHDTNGSPVSAAGIQGNFQVGGLAYGRRVRIVNCKGRNSGDIAFEIDGMTEALLDGCRSEECAGNAYLLTNFNNPDRPNEQVTTLSNCTARRTVPSTGYGFVITQANGVPYGIVNLVNCSYYRNTPDGNQTYEALQVQTVLAELNTVNFQATFDGIAIAGNATWSGGGFFQADTNVGVRRLSMKNTTMRINATYTSGIWSPTFWMMQGGPTEVDIDDFRIINNFGANNFGGFTMYGMRFALSNGLGFKGVVKGLKIDNSAGHSVACVGVRVEPTGSVAIDKFLRFRDCDFEFLGGGNVEYQAGDATNKSKIYAEGTRWITWPPTLTSITVTASPFVYQNLDMAREIVVVGGGTVSDVAFSRDGVTYQSTNQAGAMITLEPNDYVKVTYSVAPTMQKAFFP